ncbi:kinase-like protein [Aspergillus sclerotioniger CBS 115572]|uniref:Kinase-like protein n=1 Tax=Aspergillus sclerotioniger CBS 115572 TaxID=1450535 RepID=A0A317X7J1_9EURO|nr:kinase-like protein [Aspergillus sclerotioniger CBS 115572]PWY94574.1 kinase-like protein [Aspergillus sclerotioniger CBS 115572]
MADAAPTASLSSPEAAQWNKELMQRFQVALEKDPTADLMSMFPSSYLHKHQIAQYRQQSYAGQINSRTLNELQDRLDHEPEVNLLSIFPKNYTRRITMATDKPDKKESPGSRERLDLAETASVVFPLSEEVTALLAPYSEDRTGDSGKSLLHSLKQILCNSPSLWDDCSRRIVVKCSDNIVVKVIMGTKEFTEYTTLQYLAEHMPDIPAPRPHGVILFAPFRAVFMSYIPGTTLTQAWPTMTHDEKVSIQHQLDEILCRMRRLRPPDGSMLGGVTGEGVKEMRISERSLFKKIMTTTEFSDLQFSARHHGSNTYVKFLRSLLEHDRSTSEQELVFTHGDIRTDNIIVTQGTDVNSGYIVSGIIDWENSGFYPGFYECTTVTRTMSMVDEDEWFLYLPDSISPSHYPVRWLVDRLWEIHIWTT